MTGTICLRARPGEIEIAVEIGGRLADYGLWRPGAPDGYGDVHRGRVGARVAALGGAFVCLEGEADGFLPDRDSASRASVGTLLGVRITRSSRTDKGPKLVALADADDPEAASGGMRRVRRGPSPLDEMLAAYPELPVRIGDAGLAADIAPTLGDRLTRGAAGFDAALDDEVDALRDIGVALPGGARATIWPTPALVAIDVDTATGTESGTLKQVAQFAVNRALLGPLMHQVRLRNVSGAILVDFAGLAARKRSLLSTEIERALEADPLHPRLLGFTALGLAEIVRARRRPALHELRQGSYGRILDAASALVRAQSDDPHRVHALHAAPALARLLLADRVIGRDLARLSGRPLIVRSDASLEAGRWEIREQQG